MNIIEKTENGKLRPMKKEHRTLMVKGNEKSTLNRHNLETCHTIDWNHVEVVDMEASKG